MSATGPLRGEMIVFQQRGPIGGVFADFGIGQVDLARDGHVTVFPWRPADRKWGKVRHRIERAKIVAVLPPQADIATIADELNVLRNKRDMDREAAAARYNQRIGALLRQSHAVAAR